MDRTQRPFKFNPPGDGGCLLPLEPVSSRGPVVHTGVRCDNCGHVPIRGSRYKCINCADYDLCHFCEELQVHDPTHTFLKLRSPRYNADFPFIPTPAVATLSHKKKPAEAAVDAAPALTTRMTPPTRSDIVDAVNQLGFRLQHLLMAGSTQSCGLSPLNIYICLMMAASGARGSTTTAFAQTLGFDHLPWAEFTTEMIGLYKYCTKGQKSSSVDVQAGESVWYNHQFRLDPDWETLIVDFFGGVVGAVNADRINAWVSDKTKGKIRRVVENDVEVMAITLVTCLYFKADWETPFNRGRTTRGVFTNLSGKTELCNMMHRTGDMPYYEDDEAQLCVLPYACENSQQPGKTPHWKAVVILPKARGHDALAAAVSHFAKSPATFRKLLSPQPFGGELGPSLRRQSVELSLPRFTLELKSKLTQPLSEMGLSAAFAPSANFGGMSDAAGGGSGACLGPVSHHLFIEVNEEGTEMAAVTVTGLFGGPLRVPVPMIVDRPFLFMVFDHHTATVLCSVVVGDLKE